MSADLLFWLVTHQELMAIIVVPICAIGFMLLAIKTGSPVDEHRGFWLFGLAGFALSLLFAVWLAGFSDPTAFQLANDHLRYVPAQVSKPLHDRVAARAGGRTYTLQMDPALKDTSSAKNPAIKALNSDDSDSFNTVRLKPATKEHPAGSQQAYVVLTMPSPELSPANQRKAQRLDQHLEPFLVIYKYEKVK